MIQHLACITVTKTPEKCDTCPCKAKGCSHFNAAYPGLIEHVRDECEQFIVKPVPVGLCWWRPDAFFDVTNITTFFVEETEIC